MAEHRPPAAPAGQAAPDESRLLALGGEYLGWGNLGCWPSGNPCTYNEACAALADAVWAAASPGPRARVLVLGCGRAAEIRHWLASHPGVDLLGIERDAGLVAQARATGLPVQHADAGLLRALPEVASKPWDAVLCVDSAYHFHAKWVREAHALLKPGGRLAFTDLVSRRPLLRPVLASTLKLASVPCLRSVTGWRRAIAEASFTLTAWQDMDEPVLGGFERFAMGHARAHGLSAGSSGWQRAAVTARALPWLRGLGLGYVLVGASRPAP
jgi:SAM-dependent methyltransferase